MGTNFIYNRVNVNGIPCIESRSITETATAVTFNFSPSLYTSSRFSGLIAVRIEEAAVSFNVPSIANSTIALTTFGGAAVTGADLEAGIHLVFYDRYNGVLQLLV